MRKGHSSLLAWQKVMVMGFHGRSGWYIHSIGVHVLKGKLSLSQTLLGDLSRGIEMRTEMDNPQQSNKLVSTRGIEEEVSSFETLFNYLLIYFLVSFSFAKNLNMIH